MRSELPTPPLYKNTFLISELHTVAFSFVSFMCNQCIFLAAGDRQDFYLFYIYIKQNCFGYDSSFHRLKEIREQKQIFYPLNCVAQKWNSLEVG